MPPLPDDCPMEYAQLVSHCCNPIPSRRPNFIQLAEALSSYHKQLTESTLEDIIPDDESEGSFESIEIPSSSSSVEDISSKSISPTPSFAAPLNLAQNSTAASNNQRGRAGSSGLAVPIIPPRTINKVDSSNELSSKPSGKSFLSRIGSAAKSSHDK